MKQTPLRRASGTLRRTKPLTRTQPLTSRSGSAKRRTSRRKLEPGEAAWKRKRRGKCQNCGVYGPVVLHHVVTEQKIREVATVEQIAAGIVWDQRNAFRIGAPYVMGGRCRCHDGHHGPGVNDTRLWLSRIPKKALIYARELLGAPAAAVYLSRHYRGADNLTARTLEALDE